MALQSGFFNSYNGDREYDSADFGNFLEGVVTDGIFENFANALAVSTYSGMTIRVASGKAWFDRTFLLNDGYYALTLEDSPDSGTRTDAIVMEFNTTPQVRNNTLKVITGTSSSRPALIHSGGVDQYALAYITVPAGLRNITSSHIIDVRGTYETPWSKGVDYVGFTSYQNSGNIIARLQHNGETNYIRVESPTSVSNGGTGSTTASGARTNLDVPPTLHCHSSDMYGKGNQNQYGHLKLSDATDGSGMGVAGGVAATPKSVSDALVAAKTYSENRMKEIGGLYLEMHEFYGETPISSHPPVESRLKFHWDTVSEDSMNCCWYCILEAWPLSSWTNGGVAGVCYTYFTWDKFELCLNSVKTQQFDARIRAYCLRHWHDNRPQPTPLIVE